MAEGKDCIFCKIVAGEIPARVLAENDRCLAFLDVNPAADGHALVITKQHTRSLMTAAPDEAAAVIQMAQEVAKKLAASKLDPWGFNYLSNQESLAGQVVFHFHMHVIPKYAANEGFAFRTDNKVLQPLAEVEALIKSAKKRII